jgi:CRP-like cAMP-binding protein
MIDRHIAKLRARDELSGAEEAAIRAAVSEYRDIPADTTFIRAGEELDHSTVLLDGLMSRHKDLSDGRRQITELHVAGDFADLHSFTLKRLDHDMRTLTPCRVALVPHRNLKEITEAHPHLTRVYWFATNLDAAIHREWTVSLGQRSASERMAHLFCELHIRLGIVGLAKDDSYKLSLTQAELGECLGISTVHVNRMLMELRGRGWLEFERGRVTITNLPELRSFAQFDPRYLYLERRPR